MRVADQTKSVAAGEPFVFDDSFEHEAWHDGLETRITLICDIWHPDLTDREVRFLSGLQKSKLRAEKNRSAAASKARDERASAGMGGDVAVGQDKGAVIDDECDDFFALLQKTRGMSGDDNKWWTVGKQADVKKDKDV